MFSNLNKRKMDIKADGFKGTNPTYDTTYILFDFFTILLKFVFPRPDITTAKCHIYL